MTHSMLARMARNNAWANDRLLGAAAALSQADYKAPRTGFFPSLFLTLTHIHQVDLFYLDALLREGVGRAVFDDDVPDTVASLRRAQAVSDARLIAFCDVGVAPDAMVSVGWTGGPATERVEDVLLHLFQHQIHHRGQAHAMLAGTDVSPPPLDEFFPVFDRHPKAVEYLA
jgi:uncharacterized damage-inducible protein DinB